jgi:hypothetical protein
MIEKLGITPGPWVPDFDEYDDINAGKNLVACSIANRKDTKLIAAAPEMLEALIEFVMDVEEAYGLSREDFLKNTKPVLNLIEKATGKTWEEIKDLIK